jgi:hypothetical protein
MDLPSIERAIHRALLSYTRGIDRLNPDFVSAAFHPGAALVDFGPSPLTIEQFVEHAMKSLESRFVATQHRISNVNIEVADDGQSARVETYVLAFHVQRVADQPDGDQQLLHTFNGRYIDRFEPRANQWKISRRVLRNDWSQVQPIIKTMGGVWIASGRAGSPDPLDE